MALAFEQAAIYRDQIQSLHQVQEKAVRLQQQGEDCDIVVAVAEGQATLRQSCDGPRRAASGRPPLFSSQAGDSSAERGPQRLPASTTPPIPCPVACWPTHRQRGMSAEDETGLLRNRRTADCHSGCRSLMHKRLGR